MIFFFRSCSVKEMLSCFSLTVDEGFCDMSFELLSVMSAGAPVPSATYLSGCVSGWAGRRPTGGRRVT